MQQIKQVSHQQILHIQKQNKTQKPKEAKQTFAKRETCF